MFQCGMYRTASGAASRARYSLVKSTFPTSSETKNVTSRRLMAQQGKCDRRTNTKTLRDFENTGASSCAHTIIYCIESARRWRSLPRLSSPRQGEDQKTIGNAARPLNIANNCTHAVVVECTYVLYLMSIDPESVMIRSLLYIYNVNSTV